MVTIKYCISKIRIAFHILFTAIILLAFGCGGSKTFKVSGSFTKAEQTPIRLYLLLEDGATLIDSVYLSDDTKFQLKGEAEFPSIYLLKYFNGQSIYLAVYPGDKINVSIDNSTPEISYYIEGSADSKLINELSRKQNIILKRIDQLSKKLADNPEDLGLKSETDFGYSKLLREHKMYTINFIHRHPQSMANILALYQNFGIKTHSLFDRYNDIEIFDFVDSNLIALYPGSESVKVLDKQVAEAKEQIRQKKYFESTITEGRILAPFQKISVTGDTVIFPGISQKLNILYFWASWNNYSLKELANIRKLSVNSGNEINIITISLDNSSDELQKSLSLDTIPVQVICDYKYWESELVNQYSIRRIPALVLTNKEGLVLAKDVFASDLDSKISQYIKGIK
jgi:hypothetical protein